MDFNSAVILAGGKSSRMGFDKQFLIIDNKRILDKIVDELKKEFEEVIVVTNKLDEYKNIDAYKTICDEIKGQGPLSGIHIGLKEASSKFVYFIACDMPSVNIGYIRYMKSKLKDTDFDICLAKINDMIEPFNAFYSKNLVNAIENNLNTGKKSIKSLVDISKTIYVKEDEVKLYSNDFNMFINLNTIDDLNNHMKNGGATR